MEGEAGREWLATLPALAQALAVQWDLVLGDPFEPGGACSWTAPVTNADGTRAVLKVMWPHPEARCEADALRLWDGEGTVRLLAHDEERWALLVERAEPGDVLGVDWDDATVALGASLLRRLWRPAADPFPDLEALAIEWAATGRERAARWPEMLDAGIVDEGLRLLLDLAAEGDRMLLHTDLHPGNVLAATREPWLVIDPKPVVGDRGYDAFQLVVLGVHDERHLRERLALLEDEVDIPADRLRAWALARSVDWALWAGRLDPSTDYARACAARANLVAG